MANHEPARHAAVDEQPTVMQRPVMRGTQHDELVRVVVAAFGPGFQVVNVDEGRVSAAGYDARAGVAPHDLAADAWGNALAGAAWRTTHVGRLGFLRSI
jgi:hypothetical protein